MILSLGFAPNIDGGGSKLLENPFEDTYLEWTTYEEVSHYFEKYFFEAITENEDIMARLNEVTRAYCEKKKSTIERFHSFVNNLGSANFTIISITAKNEHGEMKKYTECNRPKLDQPTKIFYSSSACMYPEHNQLDPDNPDCREESAYPANPDSEYGWEKLFSERLYLAYNRNHGIPVRVARYHNIFGPEGTWEGGREKAPAAICRKVAELSAMGGSIEVWGDGLQTRSFLFIDECIEATRRLMDSDFTGPVNIGSEEMVTINELVDTVSKVSGKTVHRIHIDGPLGVRGRNSNNDLVREKLEWDYTMTLEEGISKTYNWIEEQINA